MTETYAYFWIEDFHESIKEISSRIGLQPTRAHLQGELNERGRPCRASHWEIYSAVPRDEEFLDAHITAVVDLLEPAREKLIALHATHQMGIMCVGYYGGNPGFNLSEELVARCAALRLGLQFDLYCTGGPSE